MNGPSAVLSKTEEEVNAAAMESLHLRLQACVEAVKNMPSPNFNEEQCGYLVDKLEVTVQVASSFLEVSRSNHCGPDSSWNAPKWVGIFKLLLALGKQIEDFIAGCSKAAWVEAAMTLMNVAEYVSSLGFNLELCKVLFLEGPCAAMQRGLTRVEVDTLYKTEVQMVRLKATMDEKNLNKKLVVALDTSDLAKYALQRLVSVKPNPTCDKVNFFGELFAWVVSSTHEILGRGASATVYKVMWLGTPVAKKTFFGAENPFFLKEVEILSQLCHPNITSMFCSTMNKKSCSIIMELMDCDLFALIQRCGEHSDSPPFSILESLDLMLQIAEGVNYLHTQGVIHRDLKSMNILVKEVRVAELETRYVQAKVVDFGLSKTKEMSVTYSCMTYNQGTDRWMAPELISAGVDDPECPARHEPVLNYKFKCDVYSFAMVCYEILTREIPFKDQRLPKEIKQLVLKGERPELPTDCPVLLKALIEKCWNGNPEERPTFGYICSILQFLKYAFMRGDFTPEGSEARLDHTLSEGSGCLAEVVDSKCLSSVEVDVPSSSVFKSEEMGDVLPTIISHPTAPSDVADGLTIPDRHWGFRSYDDFNTAMSWKVNAGAMKTLELRLKYLQGSIEALKKMPCRNFNKEQCGYLVKKLEVVVQVARSFLEVSRSQHDGAGSSWNVTKWVGIFKLLLSLQKRIEDFVGKCSKPAWVEAAMTLADVSEYVSSLAFNLELCKVLFSEGECAAGQPGLTLDEVGDLYKAEVEMVKPMASEDKEYLLEKVKSVSNPSCLAKHILERLVSDRSNPTKLFDWVELDTHAEQLGKGSLATVYKATLFGTCVAQKTFDGPENGFFLEEVKILSQLNHPTISMFWSTTNKKNCSIIRELMDCDLLALIRRRRREQGDSPPSFLCEFLDLMLQIAEGVNYLCTQKVIHRDLKSSNILVKMLGVTELETGYVVNFGLFMTKEMSASFSNMSYNQGTPQWMAPELVKPSVVMNKAVLVTLFTRGIPSLTEEG